MGGEWFSFIHKKRINRCFHEVARRVVRRFETDGHQIGNWQKRFEVNRVGKMPGSVRIGGRENDHFLLPVKGASLQKVIRITRPAAVRKPVMKLTTGWA